jgi:hypothetical protein
MHLKDLFLLNVILAILGFFNKSIALVIQPNFVRPLLPPVALAQPVALVQRVALVRPALVAQPTLLVGKRDAKEDRLVERKSQKNNSSENEVNITQYFSPT